MTKLQLMLWVLDIHEQRVNQDVVKSAYRRLMKVWHPDKHQSEDTIRAAKRKSQNIICAYAEITKHIQKNGPLKIRPKSTTCYSHFQFSNAQTKDCVENVCICGCEY